MCHAKFSTAAGTSTDSNDQATLAMVTLVAAPDSLKKAVLKIFVKVVEMNDLIDTGSSESFIHPDLVKHSFVVHYLPGIVFMASTCSSISVQTSGFQG